MPSGRDGNISVIPHKIKMAPQAIVLKSGFDLRVFSIFSSNRILSDFDYVF